jgi:hypothetical protein
MHAQGGVVAADGDPGAGRHVAQRRVQEEVGARGEHRTAQVDHGGGMRGARRHQGR